jgi:hypothetical protein
MVFNVQPSVERGLRMVWYQDYEYISEPRLVPSWSSTTSTYQSNLVGSQPYLQTLSIS